MRVVCTTPVSKIDLIDNGDGSFSFIAGMMIDGDGSGGNLENDPDFQDDTTLHFQGKALNARIDKGFVLPPEFVEVVEGIVLGCQGKVEKLDNQGFVQASTDAVPADIGPRSKAGEAFIATAQALGVPSSPIDGGDNEPRYCYTFWPGKPAVINYPSGPKAYELHPYL